MVSRSGEKNCEFSFANLCSWQHLNHSEYALAGDVLMMRQQLEGKTYYLPPLNSGEKLGNILRLMKSACGNDDGVLRISGVDDAWRERIEAAMPSTFSFEENRKYYDYIYSRTDLAKLEGKKYQPKRNHVNKFMRTYDYRFELLDGAKVGDCLKMENEWFIRHGGTTSDSVQEERQAILYSLNHFEELGLFGGILYADGEIAAFTYGCPVADNVFDVMVEKGDIEMDGVYAAVNKEFVNALPEQYEFINREEDLGIDSLRLSKESYHPILLLKKDIALW